MLPPLVSPAKVAGQADEQEIKVPVGFKLPAESFDVTAREVPIASKTIEIWQVEFPSAVQDTLAANRTVHGEFYRPKVAGKRPAVIVLHILGGDFALSRIFCNYLAQNGSAAMMIHMPHYGNRRTPGDGSRMISEDPEKTVAGMQQAVMDIRRGISWFESQTETIDRERIGIFGISLGGITGALAAGVEPRINDACLLLAGGNLSRIAWESKETAPLRRRWVEAGYTREDFTQALEPIEPLNYAERLQKKRVLLLAADRDEVIPRDCTIALWEKAGQPEIAWFEGGHYSVIRRLYAAMNRASDFFNEVDGEQSAQ